MTVKNVTNLAASVQARLQNHARVPNGRSRSCCSTTRWSDFSIICRRLRAAKAERIKEDADFEGVRVRTKETGQGESGW